MVLRPELPPVLSFRVNFLASLTLAGILHEGFGIDARVKWPNDILVDEHKIVGMLSDLEAEADRVAFVNIGVGINVNNDPPRIESQTTSLKKLLGRPVLKKDLLASYLDVLKWQKTSICFVYTFTGP